jgi:hypothetical protein
MIPSPLLRRALVAALATLAITWPGMVSARAQAQPRDSFSRDLPFGQLSRRSTRWQSARRRRCGVLLPRRAARRSR